MTDYALDLDRRILASMSTALARELDDFARQHLGHGPMTLQSLVPPTAVITAYHCRVKCACGTAQEIRMVLS